MSETDNNEFTVFNSAETTSRASTPESFTTERIKSGKISNLADTISCNLNPLSEIKISQEDKEKIREKIHQLYNSEFDVTSFNQDESEVKDNQFFYSFSSNAVPYDHEFGHLEKAGIFVFKGHDFIKSNPSPLEDRGKKPLYSVLYYDEVSDKFYSELSPEDLHKFIQDLENRIQILSGHPEQEAIAKFFHEILSKETSIIPTNEYRFWGKQTKTAENNPATSEQQKPKITLFGESHDDKFPSHVVQRFLMNEEVKKNPRFFVLNA